MTAAQTRVAYDAKAGYEVTSQDVEYRRDGSTSLIARIYQPRTAGPFADLAEGDLALAADLLKQLWDLCGRRIKDDVLAALVVDLYQFRLKHAKALLDQGNHRAGNRLLLIHAGKTRLNGLTVTCAHTPW